MSKNVFYIKLIHILLFILVTVCMIYMLYTAAVDQITGLTWWAFGIVVFELLVLIVNDWKCPLTDLAEKKGAEVGSVADLFLPEQLSKHLFIVFSVSFSVACLLLIWRIVV